MTRPTSAARPRLALALGGGAPCVASEHPTPPDRRPKPADGAAAAPGPNQLKRGSSRVKTVRLALALGGGAARGLAHIGVLQVLEREGIRPACIAGSSMGGLIGALSATGLRAEEIAQVARAFHFPRWFLPGGIVQWDSLFRSAVPMLSGTFADLVTPLVVTAVDLEASTQVVLSSGQLLPAIRATCAVPGVLPPVRLGGRWLVDGGLVNVLPVDVAWMADPEVVVAVKVGALRVRRIPQLKWRVTSFLSQLGGMIPNPATAKVSFEVLVRAAEIILERQTALAAAMTGPEVLIEPDLGNMTLRDFGRIDDAIAAGRRAAEAALPELLCLLESPPRAQAPAERVAQLSFDPVCAMVISPARARATATHAGVTYSFCSPNCRDGFVRDPDHYLRTPALTFGARPRSGRKRESDSGPDATITGEEPVR